MTDQGDVPSKGSVIDEQTPLILPSASQEDGSPLQQDEESSISSCSGDDLAKTSTKASPLQVVLVLVVGVFIAQLDTSFVLATHSNIASDFGQLSNSSWIVASYTLAMCAVQPCYGKISDVLGRKQLLIVAYVLFAVGSVISGIASSLSGVILGRVIAGVGGAGVNALVSLIILDLVPLRQVAKLRSYVNIVATTGRSLGGPVGGALADSIGWRWSFILQCPLLLIAGLLAFFLVPDRAEEEETKGMERLARIDFAGAGLLAASITTLMLAFELAGQKLPWNDPIIIGLVAVSGSTGVLFLITETYWAAEPVFPLHLLKNRTVVAAYLLMGLQICAQFGLMFCVPLYFQITQNAGSALAGAHLFPAVAGNACGALLAGIAIHRSGRYKLLAILGTTCAASCYVLLLLRWKGRTNLWESLYIIPGGFGTGMAEASVFIALSATIDKSMQAIALSGLFQAINVGAIVGLAASSAVLQLSLQVELDNKLDGFEGKEKIMEKALSDISYVMHLNGQLHDVIVACYVKALENTHAVSLVASIIALLAALTIKQRAL